MKILIIGSGDIGTAVAHALQKEGHQVLAMRRNPPSSHDGAYIKADITQVKSFQDVSTDFDYVLFIAAPDRRSEEAYRELYDVGLINALSHFSKSTFIFISSSAVYGQCRGEWVDDASETKPSNFRGEVLLGAEKAVMHHHDNNIIIRFSGIYGRGESHILSQLKQACKIQFEPPYYINRIHREDCIGVILFLLEKHYHDTLSHTIFLATDSSQLTRYAWASSIAKEHGLSLPTKEYLSADTTQNKRLRSLRLEALGYLFKF